MINDDLMEGSDSQNEAMDLKAPLKMGDKCPSLIRFFGAIHADVNKLIIKFLVNYYNFFSRLFGS